MAALITKGDVEALTGQAVTDARFDAVYRTAVGLIRSAYRSDPEAATGHARDVLTSAALSVATRLVTNPSGARSLGLGSANVTFGGSDEDIGSAGALTRAERDMIRSVRPRPPVMVDILTVHEAARTASDGAVTP